MVRSVGVGVEASDGAGLSRLYGTAVAGTEVAAPSRGSPQAQGSSRVAAASTTRASRTRAGGIRWPARVGGVRMPTSRPPAAHGDGAAEPENEPRAAAGRVLAPHVTVDGEDGLLHEAQAQPRARAGAA